MQAHGLDGWDGYIRILILLRRINTVIQVRNRSFVSNEEFEEKIMEIKAI
jgi:hypothetical protein